MPPEPSAGQYFTPRQLEEDREQRKKEQERLARPFRKGATMTQGEYERLSHSQQQAAWANFDRDKSR